MNNNNFIYNGCLSGSSVILGMLSGHLLMEKAPITSYRYVMQTVQYVMNIPINPLDNLIH